MQTRLNNFYTAGLPCAELIASIRKTPYRTIANDVALRLVTSWQNIEFPIQTTDREISAWDQPLFIGDLYKYHFMEKLALLARLEAKPGKEHEVESFIKSALALAQNENETIRWYALKLGPSTFGIFDTFEAEQGRQAHLSGPIAQALMAKADELLATPPTIEQISLLAVK